MPREHCIPLLIQTNATSMEEQRLHRAGQRYASADPNQRAMVLMLSTSMDRAIVPMLSWSNATRYGHCYFHTDPCQCYFYGKKEGWTRCTHADQLYSRRKNQTRTLFHFAGNGKRWGFYLATTYKPTGGP